MHVSRFRRQYIYIVVRVQSHASRIHTLITRHQVEVIQKIAVVVKHGQRVLTGIAQNKNPSLRIHGDLLWTVETVSCRKLKIKPALRIINRDPRSRGIRYIYITCTSVHIQSRRLRTAQVTCWIA